MNQKKISISDISRHPEEPLVCITNQDLIPLPYDGEAPGDPAVKPLTEKQKNSYENYLDGISAIGIPRPESKEEEDKLVESFLNGLKKLLSEENNWSFLQPLLLSLENCVKCHNCSESCPIYVASGRQEVYRPSYRAEVLRRIVGKYINKGGRVLAKFRGDDIDLNWPTIARLAESAYRCTICRRCTQACPIGVDNGLITHEIRKLFSQEMNIAPKELHKSGTVQQLKIGASTGVGPKAFTGMVQFMESEIEDKIGRRGKYPGG